jgi:hypothetical protein
MLIFAFVASVVCFALVPVQTAFAAAPPRVFVAYRTDSSIVDGKAEYFEGIKKTQFAWMYLGVAGGDPKSKGSLEIKGGRYTVGTWNDWRGKKGVSESGSDRAFDMAFVNGLVGKIHSPVLGKGEETIFYGAAETGLSEKTISWSIGKTQGEVTLPKIRSTSEQMESYVPYAEYILADGKVTGITLRMVKPDQPQSAIVKEDGSGFGEFWKVSLFGLSPSWEHLQEIKIDRKFKPGDAVEVELKLDKPREGRFIGLVDVWYKDEAQTEGSDVWQRWSFYKSR